MTELFRCRTDSPAATGEAGYRLAALIDKDGLPGFVALEGDLGAGKTEFCRGVASYFSPGSSVRSPSFNIVNEYKKGSRPVYHFDFYRLRDADDLYSAGFYDYPETGVVLVEWASKLQSELPASRIAVTITKPDEIRPELRDITAVLYSDE